MADLNEEYGALFSDYEANRQQAQRAALAGASTLTYGTSPDAAAKTRQTADYLGVAPAAVDAAPQDFDREARIRRIDQDTAKTPVVRRQYTMEEFHKLASDDSSTLAGIESTMGKLGQAAIDVGKYAVSAPDAMGGGLLSDVGKAARAVASGAPAAGAGLYGLAAAPVELLGMEHFGGFLREQQRSAEALAKRMSPVDPGAGLIERGIMSGLQSAGQNLLTLPLGVLGGEAAMLGTMGAFTFGQSYGKGREAGLSPARAIPYGVQDAVAEVITEKFFGAAGFLKNVKAGASAGKLFMYELAKEVPGEMAATLWQNFNEWANINPGKSVGEFIKEQPAALAETVIATLVGGTTQIGAVKAIEHGVGAVSGDAQRAQRAQEHAANVEQFARLMEASKLRERHADTFVNLINKISENGPAPAEMYVDAGQLANTLNQSATTIEELRAIAPEVARQLENPVPGADVRAPVAELAALGPEVTTALVDHLRESETAMSRNEAQQFLTEHEERIQQEVEKALTGHADAEQRRADMDRITQQFQQQMDAVGRQPPEVNKRNARLLAAYYTTQAARSGKTLDEFLNTYRLGVSDERGVPRGTAAQQLEQPAFHGSPHDFERFSTEKIGTGEGAQAFGHGLYFAEHVGVAKQYADNVKDMAAVQRINAEMSALAKTMAADEVPGGHRKYRTDAGKQAAARYDELMAERDRVRSAPGKLYQVEIPDPVVAKMLLWDKPLSEQPQNVRDAFDKVEAGIRDMAYALTGERDPTGEAMYRALSESLARPASEDVPGSPRGWGAVVNTINDRVANDRAASELLDSLGVPGIKFLDQGSRNRPLREIKKEFLDQLPEDADFDEVLGMIGDGTFSPANEAVLRALAADDWLGFDYPAQAISAALSGDLSRFDASPELVRAVEELSRDATHNLVVFNDKDVTITHKDGSPVTQAERDEFFQGPEVAGAAPRGTLSFASDITTMPSIITLLEGANLSTFLHESGHFFLEVQADLAARIQGQISEGASVSDSERGIVDDMNKILEWFEVKGDAQQTPLNQWLAMPLEEKRELHEQWARGFERYLMEGKAPSLELQTLFSKFRDWMVSVYRTIRGLNVTLAPEVRQVMDRMLASDQAIEEAQMARNMGPLFQTPEQAGMTPEEFTDYQARAARATQTATTELDARLMADMKWMSRARAKALKEAQAQADEARREIAREVRAEVMAQPIYRAWVFLTAKPVLSPEQTAREEASKDMRDHKQRRAEAEDAARKDERAKLYAANPDVKGLAKGQLAAKNKRQIDINVQQQMLQWDRDNPAPKLPAPAVENLGPGFATGKLDIEAVRAIDKGAAETLAKRRMTMKQGLAPDIVADQFEGFTSGEQLVRALAAAPTPTEIVQELTDQRMLERHGDITSDAALQRAADEAVHNEMRARVIAAELKALAKANRVRESGTSVISRDTVDVMATAARQYAQQIVARQRLKDLRPNQYAAAEARSARLAQQALGKSLPEAAMHTRNRLINNFATKAAYEAQAEVRKVDAFFKKILRAKKDDTAKTRDWDTVQAIRAVLAEYGIGTKGEAAQKYLETVQRNDPATFQVLSDRMTALVVNAKPAGELTVEELRGLHEEIRGMWFLAKRSRQIVVDGQLIDLETAKLEVVQRLQAIGIPTRVPGEGMAVTEAERRRLGLRTFMASLRRVEAWVESMDGGISGPFKKYVWQPIKEAADRYRADKAVYLGRYVDLLKNLDVGKSRIEAPELGYTFGESRGGSGKAEILHAVLHTGNESNQRKLLLGRGWASELPDGTLDTRRWDGFVRRMIDQGVLTKEDFDFAQGVWDLLEQMKALAQKAHRDVFGSYFDEVAAKSFTNQFGTYRGGYVPAMTDPEVVTDAAVRKLQEDENAMLAYAFPSTPKGFTQARVEYNMPLLLDLRMLSQHIDKVLLFSHMEQPIREVRRILTSRDVSTPLHRVDPAAIAMLTPWMNRAARQRVEAPTPGDNGQMRFFSKLRSRAGMAAMFANISNAAQQITGFSLAAVRVKPIHLLSAAVDYVKAPRQTARAVADSSIYMAGRMENEVAVMNDAIDQILLNPTLFESSQAWAAKHAYFLQSAVDNVMGPIIWQGAYNQALEQGMTDADAMRFADSTIRQTQGSNLAEDVANYESGSAFFRMFFQFTGYFNMQANLLGTAFGTQLHGMGLRQGMGRGLFIFMLGFYAPALVAELIAQAFRGGPGDDDKDGQVMDDWLSTLLLIAPLKNALAMIPGVGPIGNMAINMANANPADDRLSVAPVVGMIESFVKAPYEVYKAVANEGNRRNAVRDVATLISMTTGLPATAVARPLGYLAGVQQGKVAPTSSADAVRGLVTGTPSPESRVR